MTYAPRHGSTAHVLITALGLPMAPARIYRSEVRRALEIRKPENIDLCIKSALRHGVIVRGKDVDGRVWYSLPGHAQ